MCGLFGMVRSTHGPHPASASGVFAELGRLAQQRGRDAAGFALVSPPPLPVTVIKAPRPFGSLLRPHHLPLLHQAHLALGHTRHASQGAPDRLANAAPLEAGDLVGTHNGDIDQDDLRRRLPGLPQPHGDTDSEVLLLALDRVHGDLGAVCEVLSTMRGPAALAWVDRTRPHVVYLARSALSPLALAWDAQGHLYWASSPTWFRHLDEQAGGLLGLRVERVQQGTLLVVAAGQAPTIVAERRFVPVARAGDAQRPSLWAGLDPGEVAAFQASAQHASFDAARPSRPAVPAAHARDDAQHPHRHRHCRQVAEQAVLA